MTPQHNNIMTTHAAKHNTNKRHLEGLSNNTSRKNHTHHADPTHYAIDMPTRRVWPKVAKPVRRLLQQLDDISDATVFNLSDDVLVGSTSNCWQCIFGYDIGANVEVPISMLKMAIIGQEDDAEHIWLQVSHNDGKLHFENPSGLPTGEPTPELFAAQRKFVANGVQGCIRLTDILAAADGKTMVGSKSVTLYERLATDLGLQGTDVNTSQMKTAVSDMVNKRSTKATTQHIHPPIILPSSTNDDVINDLNASFGAAAFIRGNRPAHPHPYHNGSRKAVTNIVMDFHPRNAIVYDIGGNHYDHLTNGRFNVHCVYTHDNPADTARHMKWVKRSADWAKRQMDNQSQLTDARRAKMAAGALDPNSTDVWCDKGLQNCEHIPKTAGFAISVDTLVHVTPTDLFEFYAEHKILHAVHAMTIPEDYMYSRQGLLKHKEGHWYHSNDGTWTVEFVGESLPYTQSKATTDKYLTTPLFDLGELMVYSKVSGYKGAHLIIEHFILPKLDIERHLIQHVTWFNTNMDNIFVMIPDIDMDSSLTLMGREPYQLKKVVINIAFYERILNRLMQAYTWDSTLSYAAGLVGRVYATTSGLHQRWDLSNTQVRDHCLVAYWSVNRINESIRPLLDQANRDRRAPDFLTSLWESVKKWAVDFGSQFDPSGSSIVQDFIRMNKGDVLRLTQLFGAASRSIESLNLATQMVHSRNIVKWNSVASGYAANSVKYNIDTWRSGLHSVPKDPTTYDLLVKGKLVDVGSRQVCAANIKCFHDHSVEHDHIIPSNLLKVGACVCCGVLSSLMPNRSCTICSEHPPCTGRLARCTHEHVYLNDECCGSARCSCVKDKQCSCCGLPSIGVNCNVCNFDPAAPSVNELKLGRTTCTTDFEFPNQMPKDTFDDTTTSTAMHTHHQSNVAATDKGEIINKDTTTHNSSNKSFSEATNPWPTIETINNIPEMSFENLESLKPGMGQPITSTNNEIVNPIVAAVAAEMLSDNNTSTSNAADQTITASPSTSSSSGVDISGLLPPDQAGMVTPSLGLHAPVISTDLVKSCSVTDISNSPTTYLSSVSVIIRGWADVAGDGLCGANALHLATNINHDEIKQWFTNSTGHADWVTGEEIALCANAYGINCIIVNDSLSTLYRVNHNNQAVSIIHGSVIGLGAHWVPGCVDINLYASLDTTREQKNFYALLSYLADKQISTSNPTSGYCMKYASLDIESILTLGGELTVSNDGIELLHRGSAVKPTLDVKKDSVKYLLGPTGSGKTTTAHQLLGKKTLIITPSRSTVIGTVDYLNKNGTKAAGRADSQWFPDNIDMAKINSNQVILVTVDAMHTALTSGNKPHAMYLDWTVSRSVVCDEVHQLTHKYLTVMTYLSTANTTFASATLPSNPVDLRCQHDTLTHFVSPDDIEDDIIDAVNVPNFVDNTAVIVPSVKLTYTESAKTGTAAISSSTQSQYDLSKVSKACATECITTGVTLPMINRVIDSSLRIDVDIMANPDWAKGRYHIVNKRIISLTELIQARGRVGRVSHGYYKVGAFSRSTPLCNVQEILMSCYAGTPCSTKHFNLWRSVHQSVLTTANTQLSMLTGNGHTDDQVDRLTSWIADYSDLLNAKNKGHQPVFVKDNVTLESVLSIAPSVVGTKTRNTRVGSVKANISIDFGTLLPESAFGEYSKRRSGDAVLSLSADNFIDLVNDTNEEISHKLINVLAADVVNTINSIRNSLVSSHNRKLADSTKGQFPVFSSMQQAESLQGRKVGNNDIVGYINERTGAGMVSQYKNMQPQRGYFCLPNFSTSHYYKTATEINSLRGVDTPIIQKLRSSVAISGPPGSGKTYAMLNEHRPDLIVTTSKSMLDKNKTWRSPAQLSGHYRSIGVDEGGIMDFVTLVTVLCHTDKVIMTCDLDQLPSNQDLAVSDLIGETSAAAAILKYGSVETLGTSRRFGPATCRLLGLTGNVVEPYNKTKTDTITGSVVSPSNKADMSEILQEVSPDIIITSTNALAREVRSYANLAVYPISKCQGIEGKSVLLLIQKFDQSKLTDSALYVALSRHSERLTVVVDLPNAPLLDRLRIDHVAAQSYADAAGGMLCLATQTRWWLADRLAIALTSDHAWLDMINAPPLEITTDWEMREYMLANAGKAYLLGRAESSRYGTYVLSYSESANDVDVWTFACDKKKYTVPVINGMTLLDINRRYLEQLPLRQLLRIMSMYVLSKLKTTGTKVGIAIAKWFESNISTCVNCYCSVRLQMADGMPQPDSTTAGGAANILSNIIDILLCIKDGVTKAIQDMRVSLSKVRKYFDGAIAGNKLKDYVTNTLYGTYMDGTNNQRGKDPSGGANSLLEALVDIIKLVGKKVVGSVMDLYNFVIKLIWPASPQTSGDNGSYEMDVMKLTRHGPADASIKRKPTTRLYKPMSLYEVSNFNGVEVMELELSEIKDEFELLFDSIHGPTSPPVIPVGLSSNIGAEVVETLINNTGKSVRWSVADKPSESSEDSDSDSNTERLHVQNVSSSVTDNQQQNCLLRKPLPVPDNLCNPKSVSRQVAENPTRGEINSSELSNADNHDGEEPQSPSIVPAANGQSNPLESQPTDNCQPDGHIDYELASDYNDSSLVGKCKKCVGHTVEATTIKTKLRFNTFKLNLLGRMAAKQQADGSISGKINLGYFNVQFNASPCCNGKYHVHASNSNSTLADAILQPVPSGYIVFVKPSDDDIDIGQLNAAVKAISAMGGDNNDSIMQLLLGVFKATSKYVSKVVNFGRWKVEAILGACELSTVQLPTNVVDSYRALASALNRHYMLRNHVELTTNGGTTLATITGTTTDGCSNNNLFIAIYGFGLTTTACIFTRDSRLLNHITRAITRTFKTRTGPESALHPEVGGSALATFRGLGLDISKVVQTLDNLDTDEIVNWITSNPLAAIFNLQNQDTHTSIKQSIEDYNMMGKLVTINMPKVERQTIAFCIPSGHGKTTTVARIRREHPEYQVIDIDEVQEQASILTDSFDNKMKSYKRKLELELRKSKVHKHAIFCHMPGVAPVDCKQVCIVNKLATIPFDRIWSKQNLENLISKSNTIHYVDGLDDMYNSCIKYINNTYSGDIVFEENKELIDNINNILGDSFVRDQPYVDDIFTMPQGPRDRLSYKENNIGSGQQRIFVTGNHVEVARPTIQNMPSSLHNAITTRLMGRVKHRTEQISIPEYHASLKKLLNKNCDKLLAAYELDTISLSVKAVLDWLINKGNKLELVTNMLKNVIRDEHATDPANINVHYKVETLLKEQVNDVLDQVGRVIVWNNQNINMFICPIINEAKARFKTLLRPNVIYTDGMAIAELNHSLRQYEGKYLLEMDLSKQDRQTDKPILQYEWWLMERLGVSHDVVDYMTSFMPTFRIKGSNGESATLPAIHFSGGAMTSLGNEIRNLLLLSDCVSSSYVAIYTLGDDSLVIMNVEPNLPLYNRLCRTRHNVVNTATWSKTTATFLQLIIARDVNNNFYACHNVSRLREKIAYSTYPNWSSDWKAKYASYLMMIGETKLTHAAMAYCGFTVFPNLGTTMSERLHANSLHNGTNEADVVNTISDIVHMKDVQSVEVKLEIPMLLPYNKLGLGRKTVGPYKESHNTLIQNVLQQLQEY
nr:hypothetical protein [Phomopsis vexans endornavirus 2]